MASQSTLRRRCLFYWPFLHLFTIATTKSYCCYFGTDKSVQFTNFDRVSMDHKPFNHGSYILFRIQIRSLAPRYGYSSEQYRTVVGMDQDTIYGYLVAANNWLPCLRLGERPYRNVGGSNSLAFAYCTTLAESPNRLTISKIQTRT